MQTSTSKEYTSTRNACKVCTPLGASVAFKGIEGCVPLIHGSQGCATYIRRYLISHYKEPVDIASTNFTEQSAVFGGQNNLFAALKNVSSQYKPKLIGIATTCLSETIGDDMHKLTYEYLKEDGQDDSVDLVYVSTPSFKGTHADGFHNAVLALVQKYANDDAPSKRVNVFPGFVSPADIRHIKEVMDAFGLSFNLAPDYSNTLDNEHVGEYERIPEGGTTLDQLRSSGAATASIEMGFILNKSNPKALTAAEFLENMFSVPRINLGLPVGINETDNWMGVLEKLSGKKMPNTYKKQRGRLVDSYVDGHKYVFGKRAVVYGEEDFVVAMVAFLEEIGVETVLCASGGNSGLLSKVMNEKVKPRKPINVHSNYDFEEIASTCKEIKPDVMIGNSKGYYIARELGIPLVRVGFPIHDRLGGQRVQHVGYEGTQQLFDKIVNAIIEHRQNNSPVGYKYM